MKSSPHNLGNLNMRGKRSCTLRCGCCGASNLKENYQRHLAEVEMRDIVKNTEKDGLIEKDFGWIDKKAGW